jgi:hypothetical protein
MGCRRLENRQGSTASLAAELIVNRAAVVDEAPSSDSHPMPVAVRYRFAVCPAAAGCLAFRR